MNRETITKTDLEDLVRNKEELIFFFEHSNQLYLPPRQWITNKYLGLLLSGEKKLLRMN